jgi:hypothetical protein
MAVEVKRGCGYRKVGGLYLVSAPLTGDCGKLPHELHVCPTCSAGIKQSRGWTWVDPQAIFADATCDAPMSACVPCPLLGTRLGERAGLLWVGGQFYPEARDFVKEAAELGISKRLSAPPRGFVVGEHYVLIAHPRGITRAPATPEEHVETGARLAADIIDGVIASRPMIVRKAIISVFKPTALEKIVTETQMKDEVAMGALRKKGITPVAVPDDDADHQGSVFDEETPQEALL